MHITDLIRLKANLASSIARLVASTTGVTAIVYTVHDQDRARGVIHDIARAVGIEPLGLSAASLARPGTVEGYANHATRSYDRPLLFVVTDADKADQAALRDAIGRIGAHADANGAVVFALLAGEDGVQTVRETVSATFLRQTQIHSVIID